MVLISEITEAEEEPMEDGVQTEGEKAPELEEKTNNSEDIQEAPVDDNPDPNPNPPSTAAAAGAVQPPHNEYALRVAYIMRSYLSMKQSDDATSSGQSPLPAMPATSRCKAMMEVVRKEHGKWAVSKLATDHNHSLDGGGATDVPMLAMSMEFESVEAAKSFYYEFGEKSGFKARTGSNRRSSGSGDLIMQRFLCWKGSYLKSKSEGSGRKRKRGPCRKIAPKRKKAGDAVEVIPVESSTEKGGLVADDKGSEVQSGSSFNGGEILDKDAGTKGANSGVGVVADAAKKGSDDGNSPSLVANPAQSKLLRELGVRVYRYTNEERRNIILKYLTKRHTRQGSERPIKVASRQAVAERRQRGIGGRFLSRDELQTSSRQEQTTEAESDAPTEDIVTAGGEPKVGMIFINEDKAYEFYVKYAGNIGFSVRKGWWDKSARNVTRSRVYVCSREGFRPKNAVNDAKKQRPETRTGCPARMAIKIMPNGKYCISEFVAGHNHQLAAPLDIQMLKSQRLLAKVQSGGHQNAKLIPTDYKNYIRSKRAKHMRMGDAGALLEYLQKMKGDNPSFFYAIQVDEDDQLTNIFWADPSSMMEYYYFGDVVCFDMSYKANEYGRPLALFIGVNHHKQAVVFGAALLYNESLESFKWLFETFKAAMCGKQPKTILTDECAGISDAIAAIWPGTNHRLCVWQIYQNALKQLSHVLQGSDAFSLDFRHCIFNCEDEEELLSTWKTILEKYDLKDNEWLAELYEKREKWALAYGREIFCADIQRTLRNGSLNNVLKEYLSTETDLSQFFKRYEKLLDEKRFAEQQADYHAGQGMSRIPPLRLLWQAANAYTPAVFEVFRMEFESIVNCLVYSGQDVGTISQYVVTIKDKTKEHFVSLDSSDGSIICTCKKFDFFGILCCHILKILDLKNVKELPPQYVLKRWKKDAKAGSIRENHDFALDGDPKLSLPKRYSSLCRILYKIAAKAAEHIDAYAYMEGQSDQLLGQVEQILQAKLLEKPPLSSASKGQQHNQVQSENMHHDSNSDSQRVSRKKKDGGTRRRHRSGMEMNKRQKGRKGQSDEGEVSAGGNEPLVESDEIPSHPRNPSNQFFAPSQFMQIQQGQYIPSHQFEIGSIQAFHSMAQYNEETAASILQQQPSPVSGHLSQDNVQACPAPSMHPLQYGASNVQLGQQSSDQGHYSIPVWDFL